MGAFLKDIIQVKDWLSAAFEAADGFDGSEASEETLFHYLTLFDNYARQQNKSSRSIGDVEREIILQSFANNVPDDMPLTIDGFLDKASEFYKRLRSAQMRRDIQITLEKSGAVIKTSDAVFVKTDPGLSLLPGSDGNSYAVQTAPRLALLISHLRNDGVNGKPVYTDDLIITQGSVSPNMLRQLPYIVVQIPRLDMEIAVCEQVGETTFVKKGTVGPEFWAHYSKNGLKERADVMHVNFYHEKQWWSEISRILSDHSVFAESKINIRNWSERPQKLDFGLIKESLLAHRLTTGEWLSSTKRRHDGKSYILEHGPYAGTISAISLNGILSIGGRGLGRNSSIAQINQEISFEHNLYFVNRSQLFKLNLDKIKECLLVHRQLTGEWLTESAVGPNNKSYILEYGPYAGKISVKALSHALAKGVRGLSAGQSIPHLNEAISKENKLDYINKLRQEILDLEKVKSSLLTHRLETGEWLASSKLSENKKSFILKYGPYAGKISVSALEAALQRGSRGLPGGHTIVRLNQDLSDLHNLDYVNVLDQEDLDIDKIKESLLKHRQITGTWLSMNKKMENGDSYVLEHGPYAGKMSAQKLQTVLLHGSRGLNKGQTIAQLNEEISRNHNLDYVHPQKQKHFTIEGVKECLLMHYKATGTWLSSVTKDSSGNNYVLEYGPYAGEVSARTLDSFLLKGLRGLPGKHTIAKLNEEISDDYNLDYRNSKNLLPLELEKVKESLLKHRLATGEWLHTKKRRQDGQGYILEHGPYAGQLSIGALQAALGEGLRGLPGNNTILELNKEISRSHNLYHFDPRDQERLDLERVKESLLAHRMATGKWLSANKKGCSGNGYILEHGYYAGKISNMNLQNSLKAGNRGLPGGHTIAQLNEEISLLYSLDYFNSKKQKPLSLEKIKESLLAHRLATGKWLPSTAKDKNGQGVILKYGPYAGTPLSLLRPALSVGLRGLPGGQTIATLTAELKAQHEPILSAQPKMS